jgi:hypothetical protein
MSKRLRSFSLVGGLVVLAALLAFNGCSNNAPTEPNLPHSTDLSRLIPLGEPLESHQSVFDETDIEADVGGVIDIEREDYLHQFEVDAGAIDEDTQITVESYRDKIGGKEVVVFDFGPDGLVFKPAANLKFEIAELNARALSAKLFYFDPDLKKWIYQGSSAVNGGIAEFAIHHFSKYAISD